MARGNNSYSPHALTIGVTSLAKGNSGISRSDETEFVSMLGLPAAVLLLRDQCLSIIGRETEFVVGVILVSVFGIVKRINKFWKILAVTRQ